MPHTPGWLINFSRWSAGPLIHWATGCFLGSQMVGSLAPVIMVPAAAALISSMDWVSMMTIVCGKQEDKIVLLVSLQ
eukprot:scaffold16507_cov20-Attheya_sp.AAC.1